VLTALELACRTQAVPLDALATRRYLASRQQREMVSLRSIGLATARYFDLTLDDLKGASRERPVVAARCVAMWLARRLSGKSLQQIGKYFGGRDHSTVLHGCRRAEELVQEDPATRQAVCDLQARWATL
jgi:chromosomal replication initiator protein